jgi:hypothetical protein
LTAALLARGCGARARRIALDEANKQIEQKLALRRLQHRQHALRTGDSLRAYAGWREVEEASASVVVVHSPGDETLRLKLIEQWHGTKYRFIQR